MKGKSNVVMLLAAVFAALTLFAGCGPEENVSINGSMRFVIGTPTPTVYTVDLDKVDITEGALSVIKYLHETEGLEYTAQTGFLTRVGDLAQDDAAGVYLYLYTSVPADFDVSVYQETLDYDGQTLTSSGVSVTEMTVEKDCVIYIGTIIF
ncbi:MAG: hypothetical protein LBH24_05895 [Clostridiales bacterium]|jgi:hypothetical protein|nr:hypothetical protein [Clostridiales bacterium]